jgi:hypothetical protein
MPGKAQAAYLTGYHPTLNAADFTTGWRIQNGNDSVFTDKKPRLKGRG